MWLHVDFKTLAMALFVHIKSVAIAWTLPQRKIKRSFFSGMSVGRFNTLHLCLCFLSSGSTEYCVPVKNPILTLLPEGTAYQKNKKHTKRVKCIVKHMFAILFTLCQHKVKRTAYLTEPGFCFTVKPKFKVIFAEKAGRRWVTSLNLFKE